MTQLIRNQKEAFDLLKKLGASQRLIQHSQFVVDATEDLVGALEELGVPIDRTLAEIGAVLHDVGKVAYPEELSGPGSKHMAAGERLLLEHSMPSQIARFCVSHGAWSKMGCSLEELIVALADALWKGTRISELELALIDEAASRVGKSRWDFFVKLDFVFENIAADGGTRLWMTF